MYNRASYKIWILAILLAVAGNTMALQYARPDGIVLEGNWSAAGASTIWEATDEPSPPVDSDYMFTIEDATCELTLTDINDPGVDTGHVLRFRMTSTGSKGGEKLGVRLLQGTLEIAAFSNLQSRGSYETFVYALDAADVANITDYSNLRYEASTTTVDTDEEMRISWIELEVPDAAAAVEPVVSSPTEDAINTTSATLGATITDDGGDAILSRGTVWGTSSTPSTNPLDEGGTAVDELYSHARTGLYEGTLIYYAGYATNSVGTGYSTDGTFYTEPGQAASIGFSDITATGMRISWIAGTSDATYGATVNSIVIVRQVGAVDFAPVDDNTYSADPAFGSGTPRGPTTDNYVVYNGTGTQVDITSLSASTTYYVAVYAYVGSPANYQQDGPPTNSQQTNTGIAAPTLSVPTISGIDTTSATLGSTITDDGGDTILSRGTVWGTSPAPIANLLAEGGTAVSEPYSHLRTGLYEGTLIYCRGFATNSGDTGYSSDRSFYTEPGQSSSIGFSNISDTAMRISWTAGTSDVTYGATVNSIVIVRQVGAVDFAPADDSTYSADAAFGNGTPQGPTTDNYVIYNGTGTQVDITNLSASTTYYVAVYSYVGSPTNYQQDGPPTNSQQTGAAAVLATLSSNPTATAIDTTSATLGATINNDGGGAITERGTVWDTTSAPTANPVAEGGTSVSVPFSHGRTGLYEGTLIYHRGYADNSAGRAYSPDGSFYTEPGQATSIGFSNIADTAMRISWTAGTSDATYGAAVNSIVIVRQVGAVDFVPVDGSTYSADTAFGSGTPRGPTTDNYVVYNSTGTQVDVTGLTEATTYYIAVYSYVGSPTNYQQDGPAIDSQPTTGGTEPVPTLSSPTVTAVAATGATLGATVDTGAPILDRGIVWGTSPEPTGNAVSEGGTTTGTFTDTISGLSAGTLIYFAGYADNATGRGYSQDRTFYTEPDTQTPSVTFLSWNSLRIMVSWVRGSGDGIIILAKQGSPVDSAPVDGVEYTYSGLFGTGSQIGTGNYVVYIGSGDSINVTNLTGSNTYHFAVHEYAGAGAGTSGINYLQTLPATDSQLTSPPSHNVDHGISDCLVCHAMHDSGFLPRDNDQVTSCIDTCHRPGGAAQDKSNVALHLADGGATVVDCGSCHDVHAYNFDTTDTHSGSVTAPNLSRIRWDTDRYMGGRTQDIALEPALFQQKPAHFAFDKATYSSGPFNGICQSCHTRVTKHTNDGWDDDAGAAANNDHEAGSNCLGCHTHQDNFAGSGGGCTTCHDKIQDEDTEDGVPARRAVVGASNDFSLTSHHVAGGTADDDDCAVCHMESEVDHKNGLIDLRGPDTGTALTGFESLSRGSSSTLETEIIDVQDNFCLKCHDTDGATVSFNPAGDATHPFSTGTGVPAVPDVNAQFDTGHTFFHPVRGVGSNPFCTGTPSTSTMEAPWNQNNDHNLISCFDCHSVNGHGSSNQRMLLTAIDFTTMEAATAETDLPSGMGATVDALCLTCHKSSVYVSGNAGSIFEYHGADQSQHGAAGGNELGCMGCHAGTVELTNQAYSNSSAKGNIHGASFSWPLGTLGSESPVPEPTITFLLGGFIDGYKEQGQWNNQGGYWKPACGGGQCNHSGGTKYWTPMSD